MKNLKSIKLIFISALVIFPFIVLTCDTPVALGNAINVKGPTLTITSPVPVAGQTDIQVNSLFEMTGTTKGPSVATRMEIQMTRFDSVSNKLVVLGREWRYNGSWQWKKDIDVQWKAYTEDAYKTAGDITNMNPPLWKASGNDVKWSLPVTFEGLPKGDYFISVRVWDSADHTDSDSVKKLKVIHDNDNPDLVITYFNNLLPGEGSMSNPDWPGIFSDYIYDPLNDWNRTYNYIKNWVNHTLEFGWQIDKDIIGDYKLVIEITNKHNFETGQGKVLYYRYEWPGPGSALPRYGILTDGSVPTGYTRVGGGIPVADLVPRDLITGLPTLATLPTDDFVPMQIVVRLEDGDGKKDPVPGKGWFPYYPETDKPWAHIAFGYMEDPEKTPPAPDNAPDLAFLWTGQTNSDNMAFDNTDLKSLSWKLYRLKDTGLDPVDTDTNSGSSSNPWTGTIDFTENQRGSEYWNFTFSYGIGRYKLTVKAEDINGLEGDEYSSYFSIETNATPTVRGNQLSEPSITQALLGDAYGNFNIKGVAQIEDTDNTVKVDRVSIAWIKRTDKFVENTLLYTDRNYENWDKGRDAAGPKGYYQDNGGNRVWEIPAGSIVFDTNTQNNSGLYGQEEYEFVLPLNLFNDLDVGAGPGKNPAGAQTFLVRVLSEGSGGAGSKSRSSVLRVDAPGDDTPPVIEITKILIERYKDSTTETYNKEFGGFNMIPALNANDRIWLEGAWGDDALSNWSGIDPVLLKSYFSNFSVSWAGEENSINFGNLTFTDFYVDGTWKTDKYAFAENNIDPIVSLTASITDLDGNTGNDVIIIVVETDNPTLVRITSDAGDGEYGEYKDTYPESGIQHYIDIYLEFNKHVQFFTPGPAYPANPLQAPYLRLNNGGHAYYFTGNSDTRLGFRYFIDGNTNISTAPSPGAGGASSNGRLNVEEIVWTGTYPASSCVSVDGGTQVLISASHAFSSSSSFSLAGGKNIVIDKDPPVISSITTTAGNTRPHGAGSPIYITVNFNETVQVPVEANSSNFYLNLKGGNLSSQGAKAVFDTVAGASSITFRYDVVQGHDNSVSGDQRPLGIGSVYITGFAINDLAGNNFNAANANVSLPSGGALNRDLVIDTVAPGIPVIGGLTANRNYYGNDTSFNITGLESANVSVEYCLNYNTASPNTAVWVGVPNTYNIQGTTQNNYYITGIPLEINGTYNIAARQRDNATEPNVSANPLAADVVAVPNRVLGPVKVDRGALLTRLGSSTPDGIYGQGREIEIDLVFRIPVYLPGQTIPGSTAALTMGNMSSGSATATLKGYSADRKTYTFSFTTASGQRTDRLDVTGLNLGNLQFYDGSSTSDSPVNEWIKIADITPGAGGFVFPKSIGILTGNPVAITGGINPSASELRITFDRDIYRGDTEIKLIVKQIATGYRIPTVISEEHFAELFIGRSDIPNFNETQWRNIGNELYQRGSNGANTGTGNTLIPDTTVKYVLKYEVDAGDSTAGNVSGINTVVTRQNLLNGLRAAEALGFYALDKEIEIENINVNGQQRPRILKVSLAAPKALPVKGASYQWTIPNGFVKDFLESPNGGSNAGYDSALTSGDADNSAHNNNTNTLRVTGLENPAIRINNGLIETITGSGDARQARQPLRTNYKIDCRTPDTAMRYRTRQTTDNAGRLIMRNGATFTNDNNYGTITGTGTSAVSLNLPNIGSQTTDNNGTLSFISTKRRPQSGNATNTYWNPNTELFQANATGGAYVNGQNFWTPMGAWPGTYTSYTAGSSVQIGENNYLAGGMEVHIHAQAAINNNWPANINADGNAYEAAFRSVLVYNNSSVKGNNQNRDLSAALATADTGASFTNRVRTRVYVRGGDTTSGDPSIPDFPIGRDRTLAKKARLMTPFNITSANQDTVFGTSPNYSGTRTDADIIANYSAANQAGQYLWFWVTWGINVPAYVDFFSGEMASETPSTTDYDHYHVATKDFYASWTYSKEHYAVLPGRTTITESRYAYGTQADGGHGGFVYIGSVVNSPAPADLMEN